MRIVRTNENRTMQFQDLEIGDVYCVKDDDFISIKTDPSGGCIYCDEVGVWSQCRQNLNDEVILLRVELIIRD